SSIVGEELRLHGAEEAQEEVEEGHACPHVGAEGRQGAEPQARPLPRGDQEPARTGWHDQPGRSAEALTEDRMRTMRMRGLSLPSLLLLALPVTLLTAVPFAVPPAAAAEGDPIGRLDDVTSPAEGKARVTGWAADPDGPGSPVKVDIGVKND